MQTCCNTWYSRSDIFPRALDLLCRRSLAKHRYSRSGNFALVKRLAKHRYSRSGNFAPEVHLSQILAIQRYSSTPGCGNTAKRGIPVPATLPHFALVKTIAKHRYSRSGNFAPVESVTKQGIPVPATLPQRCTYRKFSQSRGIPITPVAGIPQNIVFPLRQLCPTLP